MEALNRKEQYLQYLVDGVGFDSLPKPYSREEAYLYQFCAKKHDEEEASASLQLRKGETDIEYSTDGKTWKSVCAIADLKGDTGARGTLVWIANINVSSNSDVAKTALTGPDGARLAVGDMVQDTNGDQYYISAVANDTVHVGAVLAVNLKGPKGDPGQNGADGAPGTNGKDGAAGTNGKDGAAGAAGLGVKAVAFTKDSAGAVTAAKWTDTKDAQHDITITAAAASN